jgi:AcrR family transcriptional regulator
VEKVVLDSTVEPSHPRKRRSSDDIISRIADAAAEEFRQYGYSNATTAGIAKRAHVTQAQLFRHFGSKAGLFRESVFNPLDQGLQSFLETHIADADIETVLRGTSSYIDELQDFVEANAELLTSLFVAQTYDPAAMEGVSTMSSLASYFERGASMVSARLTSSPTIDPELLVRVSFAAVLGCLMLKEWIFPPGLATQEEIRKAINDFVTEGIAANSPMGPLKA